MDLAIRNATIVDGTGAPARTGDLGIDDGRIVAIAEAGDAALDGADRTIDATGLMLCPGFVDPHTHYDAQLFWDPTGSPSNLHGVTTVIAGNCGFTLAPLRQGDGDYTAPDDGQGRGHAARRRSRRASTGTGRSFAEYLDRLEGNLGVNAGFLVGHCAAAARGHGPGRGRTRGHPRAARRDEASCSRESIAAGGLGFSTTLARTHSDGDGEPVASRWADRGGGAGTGRRWSPSTRARRSSSPPTAASTASRTTRSTS